jgi:hypothetical protein
MFNGNTMLSEVWNVGGSQLGAIPPELWKDSQGLFIVYLPNAAIVEIAEDTWPANGVGIQNLDLSGNPSICYKGIDTNTGIQRTDISCRCADGYYSSGRGQCLPVMCPTGVHVPTASLTDTMEKDCSAGLLAGSKCTVRCGDGFTGSADYTCSNGGQWMLDSGAPLDCQSTIQSSVVSGLIGAQMEFTIPTAATSLSFDDGNYWDSLQTPESNGWASSIVLVECLSAPILSTGTLSSQQTITFEWKPDRDVAGCDAAFACTL